MSDERSALQSARQRLARALATGGQAAGPAAVIRTGPDSPDGPGRPDHPGHPDRPGPGSRSGGPGDAGGRGVPAGPGDAGGPDDHSQRDGDGGRGVPAGPAGPDRPAGRVGALARLGGSAFDPGRSGLRALAAVAAVVILGAAALAWWSRPQPEPVVPQLAATGSVPVSPTGPAVLVVAVSGKVHLPGLVELPPGARVADAIEAAGGLLPDAEVEHLNLARKLVDGELVAVGIPPPPAAPAGTAPGGPGPGGKLNLNTATAAELELLPGIGPALAQRIIDHRTASGPFRSVGELREVSGIGEVRFAELADLVTV